MDHQLATSRDLAAHHAARAAIYSALWQLLGGTSATRLQAIQRELRATGQRLAQDLAAELANLPVPTPSAAVADRHLRQIRVLAMLSKESAAAIHDGELSEAALLCELQESFLDRHAAPTLEELGRSLAAHEDRSIRLIGTWLTRMLEDGALG